MNGGLVGEAVGEGLGIGFVGEGEGVGFTGEVFGVEACGAGPGAGGRPPGHRLVFSPTVEYA